MAERQFLCVGHGGGRCTVRAVFATLRRAPLRAESFLLHSAPEADEGNRPTGTNLLRASLGWPKNSNNGCLPLVASVILL